MLLPEAMLISLVVHVATKGHVGAYDPAVARGCVDVCALCYHQSLWSVLLPESMMMSLGCATQKAMLTSVAYAAAKGHEGVSSPCCAWELYCCP